MESKVLMIDASGVELGETYSRRARQLVKQQRAIWADDTHTAIQFMPDQEEDWEASEASAPTKTAPAKSKLLYVIAEKRIKDRKQMLIHTVLFIPGYFAILLLWMIATNARMFNLSFLTMGFAWGAWTMGFISHLRHFAKTYGHSLKTHDGEARRKIRLEMEVERLKKMGYTE